MTSENLQSFLRENISYASGTKMPACKGCKNITGRKLSFRSKSEVCEIMTSFRTSRRLKHAISQRKERKRWKKVLRTNHNDVIFHFIDNCTNPGLVL